MPEGSRTHARVSRAKPHSPNARRDPAAHCLRGPAGITRRDRRGRPLHAGATTIFITPAFAQSAGAASDASGIALQLVPFAGVLVIMYFLILRPQQRRAKDQADLIKNIRRGDTVVTTGGIIGKVTKATEATEIEIEIAPNVRIRVARPMVTEVRAKGEPVKDVAV